jgi:threonine dehydrogenase-like Zn-dependent dehydrogenase
LTKDKPGHDAIPEGLEMARRLFCRARFRRCGRHPDQPHRHLLANQIRLYGMPNHPPTGYPSSLRLLNKFKTAFPLEKFVTHEFPVDQVDKAMATAFDIDSCMKVVLTPSRG